MEIEGKLIKILPIETGVTSSGNLWEKQSIIVDNNHFFESPICFSIFSTNIDFSILKIGTKVLVDFEIESKESNGKWYNNINVFTLKIFDEKNSIAETFIINKRPDFRFTL